MSAATVVPRSAPWRTLAAAGVLLAATGCGGAARRAQELHDTRAAVRTVVPQPRATVTPSPSSTPKAAPAFTGERFTAPLVQAHFRRATGVRLQASEESGWIQLELPRSPGDYALQDRFGFFSLYLVRSPLGLAQFLVDDARRPVRPDADGVRWSRGSSGGYGATKVYGANLVLSWLSDEKRMDPAIARTDRVLSALARRADVIDKGLRAADRRCGPAGKTPAGRTEGACRDGAQRVVIAGATVRAPGVRARVRSARLTRAIRTGDGSAPLRPAGVFLLARVRVDNTASQPRYVPDDFGLRVGDQVREPAREATTRLSVRRYPVPAGGRRTVWLAYDVAPRVAQAAARTGALAFPGDALDDPVESPTLALSRLRGMPARVHPSLRVHPDG